MKRFTNILLTVALLINLIIPVNIVSASTADSVEIDFTKYNVGADLFSFFFMYKYFNTSK